MKPDSLWSAGIGNTNPGFLTNLTSGINNDIRAANAADSINEHTIIWHNQSAQWLPLMFLRLPPMGNSVGLGNGKEQSGNVHPNGRRALSMCNPITPGLGRSLTKRSKKHR